MNYWEMFMKDRKLVCNAAVIAMLKITVDKKPQNFFITNYWHCVFR